MKRKISILLTLVIVVSSALLLAACNQSEYKKRIDCGLNDLGTGS